MAIESSVIGANIRRCRILADLTQEQLCRQIGITPKYLSRLEKGIRTPSLDVLSLIASALHTSIDELVSEQPKSWPPQSDLVYFQLFSDCTQQEFAFLYNLVLQTKHLMRRG